MCSLRKHITMRNTFSLVFCNVLNMLLNSISMKHYRMRLNLAILIVSLCHSEELQEPCFLKCKDNYVSDNNCFINTFIKNSDERNAV